MDESRRSPSRWIYGAVGVVCLGLAVLPLVPTQLRGGGPDMTGFSADAAMNHVEIIARAPHPIGSAEHSRVGGYLIDSLSRLGFDAATQTIEVPDYFGVSGGMVEVTNVLVKVDGHDSTGAVIVVAHYDTVPSTPGANDNSTSVGILLELAESLISTAPLRNDVILLFSDGEEPAPRLGSPAFVSTHPWFDDVRFVVNLEASGSGGPSLLIESSGPERWGIDLLAEAAPYPAAFSFITEISHLIGGFGTDFDPFKESGVPGISFSYSHGSPIYHTEADEVSSVSLATLRQQGANTLALVRLIGEVDFDAEVEPGGAVFFTIAGSHVVRYSDTSALVISIVGVVGFGLAFVLLRRREASGQAGILPWAGFVIALFLGSLVVGAVLWTLFAGWRDTPGVVESYVYLTLLLALVLSGWLWAVRRFSSRHRPSDVLGGVVAVLVLFSFLTSTLAPGTSYLFAWPALAGLLYWGMWPTLRRFPLGQLGAVFALTLVVLIVNVPAIDIFYQMAQPRPGNPDSNLMPVAGVALSLWVLTVALIHSVASHGVRNRR